MVQTMKFLVVKPPPLPILISFAARDLPQDPDVNVVQYKTDLKLKTFKDNFIITLSS